MNLNLEKSALDIDSSSRSPASRFILFYFCLLALIKHCWKTADYWFRHRLCCFFLLRWLPPYLTICRLKGHIMGNTRKVVLGHSFLILQAAMVKIRGNHGLQNPHHNETLTTISIFPCPLFEFCTTLKQCLVYNRSIRHWPEHKNTV